MKPLRKITMLDFYIRSAYVVFAGVIAAAE